MKSIHLDPGFPTFRAVPVLLVKVFIYSFPLLEWAEVWIHSNMSLPKNRCLQEEQSSNVHTGWGPSAWRRAIQSAQFVTGSEWSESENTWLGKDLSLGSQPSSGQAIRTSSEREKNIWKWQPNLAETVGPHQYMHRLICMMRTMPPALPYRHVKKRNSLGSSPKLRWRGLCTSRCKPTVKVKSEEWTRRWETDHIRSKSHVTEYWMSSH